MIIISSIRMVYRIVGHGRPAVKSRSMSSSGVVMTLIMSMMVCRIVEGKKQDSPVNVSNVEDLTEAVVIVP